MQEKEFNQEAIIAEYLTGDCRYLPLGAKYGINFRNSSMGVTHNSTNTVAASMLFQLVGGVGSPFSVRFKSRI